MTTDRVMEYARTCFKASVEAFLDDPHGMLATGSEWATPVADYVEECRLLARDMGLDFDQLIATMGHQHERDRVHKLMDAAGCRVYAVGPST